MNERVGSSEDDGQRDDRRQGARRIGRALSRFRRGGRAAPEQLREQRNDEARISLASARETLNTSQSAAGEIARALVDINERLVRAEYPGELVDPSSADSLHWDDSRASSTVSWSPPQTALSGLPDHRGIRHAYKSPMADSQTGLQQKVNDVRVTRRTEVDIAEPSYRADTIDVELTSVQRDENSNAIFCTQRFTYTLDVDGMPVYRAEEYRTQSDSQSSTDPKAVQASPEVFVAVADMVKVMATDSADYQPFRTTTLD